MSQLGATQVERPNLPPLREASFEDCHRDSVAFAARDDFDDEEEEDADDDEEDVDDDDAPS